VSFVGRRQRESAEELIRARGGTPSERGEPVLVAVFDGPDMRARTSAAVDSGLAVLAAGAAEPGEEPPVTASLAVAAGPAQVGSTRVERAGRAAWVYGAEGEPVELAARLARGASGAGVLLAGAAAAAASDRYRLEPAGDDAYRVLAPAGDADDARPAPDRRIRTILVTDIVGSTRILARVGDRAWGELVAAHERATRSELVRLGGEVINTTGDGFLASFASTADAIRCALAVMDRLAALGLRIRAGIHTGEVELAAGPALGIAVKRREPDRRARIPPRSLSPPRPASSLPAPGSCSPIAGSTCWRACPSRAGSMPSSSWTRRSARSRPRRPRTRRA
jgi:class 3 adenylate cyclase